ncbi:hypothetical protein HDU77_011548 [Chytriomyces hyalinus]|nr:hypothetical protein HDU77_011548 [Chytriomyces hyalinus]
MPESTSAGERVNESEKEGELPPQSEPVTPESLPFSVPRHPTWSLALAGAVATLRAIVASLNSEHVDLAMFRHIRLLSELAAVPTHYRVAITDIMIPRRSDLTLLDMKPEDAEGDFPAEWIEYGPSLADFISSARNSFSGEALAENGTQLSASVASTQAINSAIGPDSVVLYIHGGAYCLGSRKTHRGITWKIAKYSNCRVLSIDYRLAPEHVFPLPLHDVISAYSFLVNPPENSNSKKYDASKIVFMADSAGGGLALAAILWLRDHGSDAGLAMPGGAALLSPWLDLTHSMPSFRSMAKYDYLPDKVKDKILNEDRNHYYIQDNSIIQNPLVSPLFAVDDPDAPLPPILIQIGECERLRDENLFFVQTVFPNSVIQLEMYESMVHVFQFFSTILPFAEFAVERLGSFVQTVTRPESAESAISRQMKRFRHSDDFPGELMTSQDITKYLEQGELGNDWEFENDRKEGGPVDLVTSVEDVVRLDQEIVNALIMARLK